MRCPRCQEPLQVVGRFAVCPEHGAVAEDAAGRAIDGIDLERIPSVVAIPLGEYLREPDPVLRLWAACDTVELTLRLLFAVGLADVLRSAGGKLPDEVRAEIGRDIEEPTLGRWRSMVEAVARRTPEGAVVPELPGFVTRALVPLLRGPEGRGTVEHSLAALRNQLAHGGGMTRSLAARLVDLHAPRFEEAMRAGAWLGDLELVAPRPGREPCVLAGPRADPQAFRATSVEVGDRIRGAAAAGDAVVLVRGREVLKLWPLIAYGLPRAPDPDAPPASREVPQVYVRRGEVRLQLTPIGSVEVAQSEGDASSLAEFLSLFRRETDVAKPPAARASRVRGCDAQLDQARGWRVASVAWPTPGIRPCRSVPLWRGSTRSCAFSVPGGWVLSTKPNTASRADTWQSRSCDPASRTRPITRRASSARLERSPTSDTPLSSRYSTPAKRKTAFCTSSWSSWKARTWPER